MRKYIFKAGNHDASPGPQVPRVIVVKGFLAPLFPWRIGAKFRFTPDCWFDWRLPDGTLDNDIYDWNFKLWGLSPVLQPGNWNGVMLAARPNPAKKGVLEFTFYQNIDREVESNEAKRFEYNIADLESITVYAMRQRRGQIEFEVFARMKDNRIHRHGYVFDMRKDYATYRELFLWFGGANNAEGEFGGVPDKNIVLYAESL